MPNGFQPCFTPHVVLKVHINGARTIYTPQAKAFSLSKANQSTTQAKETIITNTLTANAFTIRTTTLRNSPTAEC